MINGVSGLQSEYSSIATGAESGKNAVNGEFERSNEEN
ncbi:hypothetical protein R83H12_02899 [Fibrobacteria bacterium R8-3-H12]